MSSTRKSNSLYLKIILSIAAIIITVGVIEIAGRYLFADEESGDSPTLELIENAADITKPSGNKLRLAAWEASFTERGLEVPESGPRDGKTGDRISKNRCMVTDCRQPGMIPGVIEIDEFGYQNAGDSEDASPSILIIGGSVAWGAAASDIENTYFYKLYELLKENYPEVGISVLAGAGSTSSKDLYAFVNKGIDKNPDLVIFLNALNDITVNDSDIKSAGNYVLNMRTAAQIAERNGIDMVIVRQPFPGNKKTKTELEKRILELSKEDYEENMISVYKYIGVGLEKIEGREGIYYIDAGGCFDDESATTFSDQWHFSDPGQELLAECMYDGLLPVLVEISNDSQ